MRSSLKSPSNSKRGSSVKITTPISTNREENLELARDVSKTFIAKGSVKKYVYALKKLISYIKDKDPQYIVAEDELAVTCPT